MPVKIPVTPPVKIPVTPILIIIYIILTIWLPVTHSITNAIPFRKM